MAQWTTYRLEPRPGAGFHFGLRGLAEESSGTHYPSDTLFAALVTVLAEVEGPEAVEEFAAPFAAGQPPFLLTSAFPRAADLPLLPMPFVRVNLTEKPGQRKLLKRLRYVSPVIFNRILDGGPMDAYADDEGGKGAFLQGGRVWIAAEEIEKLPETWKRDRLRAQKVWKSKSVDRVAVDRVTSASTVYRTGRTVYAPGCGLWFGVRWAGEPDPAWQTQLETLLAHLSDVGIGGERSVGYGQFTPYTVPLALDLPEATPDGPTLTLSRYLPRQEELPDALRGKQAAYRLVTIPGWLSAPGRKSQRRRQVRMLVEGAVFRPVGPGPWGRMADARPAGWEGHPIYRYGYACPVGVRPQEVHDA
ncbi:MAG: type III-A CRISPR-associated RAMP protein Csm4 [Anaerolineae bacterium]